MEPSYSSYNRSNRNVSRFGDGAEALNDVTVVCGRTITTKQKVHDLSFGETSPIDPLLHFDESQAAVCEPCEKCYLVPYTMQYAMQYTS